jgi:hypothetical protein
MSAEMRGRGLRRLVLGLLLGVGCGPSRAPQDPLELEEFVSAFGQEYCHRVYTCCGAGDVSSVSPGESESVCAEEMAGFARANAAFLLSYHGIVYDAAHASRCIELLRSAACSAIFEPRLGALITCQDIFPGALPAGEECDDDHECLSGRCDEARCGGAPLPMCSKGQFLDEARAVCVQRHALGEACSQASECGVDATCVHEVCVKPYAEGVPCESQLDCEGTCADTPAGARLCRTGFCRGL